MKYIDTSLIVSALDPEDPSSTTSLKYLKENGKVVSELVIGELNSVMFRNRNFINLLDKFSGDRITSSYAVIIYILQKFDLMYFPIEFSMIKTPVGRYSRIVAYAFELAEKIPMKTLDLLHLSYAHAMGVSSKSAIEFVTRDREFKTYQDQISEAAGIKIICVN